MSKLGRQFGISDVALRKKSKKHNMPTPGVGYWAKVVAGSKPRRPKLRAGIAPIPPRAVCGVAAENRRAFFVVEG